MLRTCSCAASVPGLPRVLSALGEAQYQIVKVEVRPAGAVQHITDEPSLQQAPSCHAQHCQITLGVRLAHVEKSLGLAVAHKAQDCSGPRATDPVARQHGKQKAVDVQVALAPVCIQGLLGWAFWSAVGGEQTIAEYFPQKSRSCVQSGLYKGLQLHRLFLLDAHCPDAPYTALGGWICSQKIDIPIPPSLHCMLHNKMWSLLFKN